MRLFVVCLLNVPATCWCSSGTDFIFACCHTELEGADQSSYLSRHSVLTSGQPFPSLNLKRQTPGRVIIIIIIIIIIVIIIIMMMMMMMIIAFKGATRNFLQSPHSAANCLQHARSSGSGEIVCKPRATHRALITCNMSCYVPLGTKGRLSY